MRKCIGTSRFSSRLSLFYFLYISDETFKAVWWSVLKCFSRDKLKNEQKENLNKWNSVYLYIFIQQSICSDKHYFWFRLLLKINETSLVKSRRSRIDDGLKRLRRRCHNSNNKNNFPAHPWSFPKQIVTNSPRPARLYPASHLVFVCCLLQGTEQALHRLQLQFPDLEVLSLSGNYCTDKKAATVNWILGRGKSAVCEATVSGRVVKEVKMFNWLHCCS